MTSTDQGHAGTELREHPTAGDLRRLVELAQGSGDRCVSIYLTSPRSPGFAEQRAIEKRWRGALDAARRSLEQRGGSAEATVAKLEGLDVGAGTTPGGEWTLAAFASPEAGRAWSVPERLGDRVDVGGRFTLRPLFLAVHRDTPYRVLVVSPDRVRLLEGRGADLVPLDAPDVPVSLVDALGPRLERSEDVQHHVEGPDGRAVFHGHGGRRAEREVDDERFHRAVTRGVAKVWGDRGGVPLIVLADRARLSKLVDGLGGSDAAVHGIEGNFDESSLDRIRSVLLPRLRRLVAEVDAQRIRACDEGAGGPVVKDLATALDVAEQGRVRRAWVAADGMGGRAEEDVERLLARVSLHGGEVAVVAPELLPADAELLGELRG